MVSVGGHRLLTTRGKAYAFQGDRTAFLLLREPFPRTCGVEPPRIMVAPHILPFPHAGGAQVISMMSLSHMYGVKPSTSIGSASSASFPRVRGVEPKRYKRCQTQNPRRFPHSRIFGRALFPGLQPTDLTSTPHLQGHHTHLDTKESPATPAMSQGMPGIPAPHPQWALSYAQVRFFGVRVRARSSSASPATSL